MITIQTTVLAVDGVNSFASVVDGASFLFSLILVAAAGRGDDAREHFVTCSVILDIG